MDAFLESLHDVSLLLLPFAGLLCLIFLAILIYRLMVAVKPLPQTIDRANKTIDSLDSTVETANELIVTFNEIVDKLNEPMNTIVGVAHTVDKVNSAANGVAASVATYAIKNSDTLVNWGKDMFSSSKKQAKKESEEQEVKEEDFGVYE